jgi:hypothetical protein
MTLQNFIPFNSSVWIAYVSFLTTEFDLRVKHGTCEANWKKSNVRKRFWHVPSLRGIVGIAEEITRHANTTELGLF